MMAFKGITILSILLLWMNLTPAIVLAGSDNEEEFEIVPPKFHPDLSDENFEEDLQRTSAYALPTYNRLRDGVKERIRTGYNECMATAKWTDSSCQFTTEVSFGDTEKTSAITMGVVRPLYKIIRFIPSFSTFLHKKLSNFPGCGTSTEEVTYRIQPATSVVDGLVLLEQERSMLSPCQSACLAVCMSNRLLGEYDLTQKYIVGAAFKGVEESIQRDGGICWDAAKVTAHFSKVLGLDYKTVSNFPHSFTHYKFDGKWYSGETMDSKNAAGQCTFRETQK